MEGVAVRLLVICVLVVFVTDLLEADRQLSQQLETEEDLLG
jgi:hypothetical protein